MKYLKPSFHKIDYDWKSMTMKEWSEYLGIKYQTLYQRLRKGYDLDRVFAKEIPQWNPNWLKSRDNL